MYKGKEAEAIIEDMIRNGLTIEDLININSYTALLIQSSLNLDSTLEVKDYVNKILISEGEGNKR